MNDIELLQMMGEHLDFRPPDMRLVVEAEDGDGDGEPEPEVGLPSSASIRELLLCGLLKIRDKRGRLRELAPNRTQREFEQRAGQRNIVLKSRQVGMTTYLAARFFVSTITHPGTVTVLVAHDQESAEGIFKIVHRFWEKLPRGLREGALRRSRANVRQMAFSRIDSEFRVASAADDNAGRGLTIQNLHCSEVARWPADGEETLLSLRAAVTPQGEIVLESTPRGAGGLFYEEWQGADATGYVRHFFPWWLEPSYVLPPVNVVEMSDEECDLVRAHGLKRGQIAFRRSIRATMKDKAAQEYAEDPQACFLASTECLFDLTAIAARLGEVTEAGEHRDNGRLAIYYPAMKGHEYILGVDPAGGGSEGDHSCVQVIDRATGLQCAEFLGHLGPGELAPRVAEMAREYNHAVIAVERNNHGHAVLAHLFALPGADGLRVYEQQGKAGWLTNVASRPRMLANFAAVLAAEANLFGSQRLLGECRTFVRNKDGSPAAAAGAHDDCVMAMAIALAVRMECGSRSEAVYGASLPRAVGEW